MKKRKKIVWVIVAVVIALLLTTCRHEHVWQEATCSAPKTCTECGDTEGTALPHTWTDATCTVPKTCSVCGTTEDTVVEHIVDSWIATEASTCTSEGKESGKCTVCGETAFRSLPLADHTPGEWVVTTNPTATSDGERTKSCTVCGEVLETEIYSLPAEEVKAQYIASCTSYSYDTIARDPDSHMFTYGAYTGEIIQVLEDGDELQLRVNITPTSYGGYEDTIYVLYTQKEGASRLLEDDIVNIYGINMGTISYESIFGATITLPCVYAEYIDLR